MSEPGVGEGVLNITLEDYAGRKITFAKLGEKVRKKLSLQTLDECRDILNEAAINIRNEIIKSMRDSPPTGRLYFKRLNKKGKPIYHRASSPGNPPRVDTGDLVRSIGMDVRELGDEIEVGSRITKPKYPEWLEKGTPNGQMKPRPWLGPAFKKEEPELKRKINEALRKAAGG